MALYQLTEEGGVIKTDTGAYIPPDPKNREWKLYLKWVTLGGVPDPIPAPTPKTDAELLYESDQKMIRAVDWLLEYLVTTGLTNGKLPLADIPQVLKDLYLERKAQRGA